MLKFRYFYTGTFYLGFARRYNLSGSHRYLILLDDSITLTIAQVTSGKGDKENTWYQVPKVSEPRQSDDLIQSIGAALSTAKEF
jgi:hypothetical protein